MKEHFPESSISIAQVLAVILLIGIVAVGVFPIIHPIITQCRNREELDKTVFISKYDGAALTYEDSLILVEVDSYIEEDSIVIVLDNKGEYLNKLYKRQDDIRAMRDLSFSRATDRIEELSREIAKIKGELKKG